jgi:2,3-dihydroxybenzoate decarboxylase
LQKIALEEHCMIPGFEDYWEPTVRGVERSRRDMLLARLSDLGSGRLEAMDEAGIAIAVLSLAGPGVQVETDVGTAVRKAREANDWLAVQIQKHPRRLGGFAHLAMQDARAAADELERAMRDLNFSGALINGHTHGQYLDHAALDPFWERAEALDAAVYIHPADPVSKYPALADCKALNGPMWEWGVETGTHALRLVMNGVFDRFPRAKLVLGHLGETLPFLLWRFDSRAQHFGLKFKKPPSAYIRENIWVTTSGMFSADPLACTLSALGTDHVMFSADHPFESMQEAGEFMDSVALDEEVRKAVAFRNAATLLRLPLS